MAPGATAIIGTTTGIIRLTLPLRNAIAIARAMTESKTIQDHRVIMPGIYFGNMNDKIKQLLATAEKVDGISKIKWRIENRELLRKQRKLELKKLMENDSVVKWFYDQLVYHKIIKIDPSSSYKSFVTPLYEKLLAQAMQAEKERLELSYQDGKEIGTIETLLKNKNL